MQKFGSENIERHIDQGIFAQVQKTKFKEYTRMREIISQVNHPSLKDVDLHRDEQGEVVD